MGLYGLLLVPAGAIVVTEHWIFPRIGLTRYWASSKGLLINWAALIAWVVAIGFALLLERTGTLHLFFLFLPVYLLTSLLYIGLASIEGARGAAGESSEAEGTPVHHPDPISQVERAEGSGPSASGSGKNWLPGLIAVAALIACFVMPLLVCLAGPDGHAGNLAQLRQWLILPSLIYFVAGTLFYIRWQRSRDRASEMTGE